MIHDVIIIGAGYTGLSAAYTLSKQNIKSIVIEARSRVGGRTLDYILADNKRLELGGQYISSSQKRINKLANEMGMELFESWGKGSNFFCFDKKVGKYTTTPAQCLVDAFQQPQEMQHEIEATIARLQSYLAEVPEAAPWLAPQALAWDSITFESWLEQTLKTQIAKDFFKFMINQGFSTEPEQISLLQALWFFKTSHGLPVWALGGAQAYRIVGGTQLLAEQIANYLGNTIIYEEPVVSIDQNNDIVTVRTTKNVYSAQAVIVCVPPQLISTIWYQPALPSDLFRAFASLQTGNSMKAQAVYEYPFWREQGWSGNGIMYDGPQTFTFDNSLVDGKPGVLLGFLSAQRATEWNRKSSDERKKAVLHAWATVFGERALNPIDYIEMDWAHEPFTRGGHGCHFSTGVWAELGSALGASHMPRFKKIIWAASDLAKDWNGYLEGALYAGEQAAQEIITVVS